MATYSEIVVGYEAVNISYERYAFILAHFDEIKYLLRKRCFDYHKMVVTNGDK